MKLFSLDEIYPQGKMRSVCKYYKKLICHEGEGKCEERD